MADRNNVAETEEASESGENAGGDSLPWVKPDSSGLSETRTWAPQVGSGDSAPNKGTAETVGGPEPGRDPWQSPDANKDSGIWDTGANCCSQRKSKSRGMAFPRAAAVTDLCSVHVSRMNEY